MAKKSSKVPSTPVTDVKSARKGNKRGADKAIEKVVSAKKQKLENDEAIKAEQKLEKKQPKKVESNSESEESSESEDEVKAGLLKKKQPPAKCAPPVTKKAKDSSLDLLDSSESDSESDDSDKKPKAAVKNGTKKDSSGDESDSDSDSESSDEEKPKSTEKHPVAAVKNGTKKDSSSDEDDLESDSESSEEEVKKVAPPTISGKNGALPSSKKKDESDESSDDSSDEDKTAGNAGKSDPEASKGSESDEECSKKEPSKGKQANGTKQAKEKSISEEENSDDESSDEEPSKATIAKNASKKSSSSGESSDEESEESNDDDDSLKTPKKRDRDVEMVDASQNQSKKSDFSTAQKTPKTPTAQSTGSKTLFVGNLSFNVEEKDVREFFKTVAEVVDVRFSCNPDGQFKGFGHVEFATPEEAHKALESLNGEHLLNRAVRLDIAHERGAYTPNARENNSYQKGGQGGVTAFVKGFDKSLGEDEIRSALQNHFGSCGNITRLSIPPDYENGGVKGMAYIDFGDSDALNKALELDGSEVNGWQLVVNEAKPRGGDTGGRGGRSGGRFGGRGGGSGGRFGGHGGGRFGGRGGRGGRTRGPNKPSFSATPTGKKTSFAD